MTKRLQRLSRQLDEAIEFAIDLGKRYDAPPMCSPLASNPSVHYPSLYIDREDDSLDDLPDEGKATIHYKVKSRTKSEYDGKKSRSVSVDVMSIEPEEEDGQDEDEEDEGEGDEDDVKRQRLSAIIDGLNEFMDRTRDDMGRFQANQTGGIDPLTVKQAYPKKPSMLRTAGLVAVGAGAAKFGPGMIRSARKAIQNRAGLATGKVATVKATRNRQYQESQS